MADEARNLSDTLVAGFLEVATRTADLKTNIGQINQSRDQLINRTIEGLNVSDSYIMSKYASEYASFSSQPKYARYRPETVRQKFLEGLTIDKKLEIIAEHRNNQQLLAGEDKFSADLAHTQKNKADAKRRYKEAAAAIIADYEAMLKQSEDSIRRLENLIDKQNEKIAAEEEARRKVPGTDETTVMTNSGSKIVTRTQADVDAEIQKHNDAITELNTELKRLQTELNKMRQTHNKYVTEFAKRKNEIEDMLAKGKIYNTPEQPSDTNASQNQTNTQSHGNSSLVPTIDNPRELARSMLQDFYDRSPEEQRTILAQCGSRDLLNAARHLGIINRRKLARVLAERIDELDGDLTFTGKNGTTVTVNKEKLSRSTSRRDGFTAEELKIIAEEIKEFNDNLGSKSLDEIRAFESKIQYIRYASYMQEAGWFRNITKHFDFLTGRNYRMTELSKTLARYATLKNERDRNQVAQLNKWRTALKLNPVSDYAITNPRALDRTGQDSILRQDYYQDNQR